MLYIHYIYCVVFCTPFSRVFIVRARATTERSLAGCRDTIPTCVPYLLHGAFSTCSHSSLHGTLHFAAFSFVAARTPGAALWQLQAATRTYMPCHARAVALVFVYSFWVQHTYHRARRPRNIAACDALCLCTFTCCLLPFSGTFFFGLAATCLYILFCGSSTRF